VGQFIELLIQISLFIVESLRASVELRIRRIVWRNVLRYDLDILCLDENGFLRRRVRQTCKAVSEKMLAVMHCRLLCITGLGGLMIFFSFIRFVVCRFMCFSKKRTC
jgi:hypothetical protein